MSQQQNSWDDLVQSWNANDTAIDQRIPSKDVLIDQIYKTSRQKKLEVIVSLIASTALTSYIIWEMFLGLPSIADTLLYSVILVMALASGLYTIVSAKRFSAAPTDDTQSHVNVLVEQSKNNLAVLSFSRVICSISLLIALFLLGLILFVAMYGNGLAFKHYLVGGIALGCSLLCSGLFIWFKKQRLQLEHQIGLLTS